MDKTHDRRFLGALGFLGFLGSENLQHLARFARFAWLASLAGFAFLVFVPRQASKVDPRYRLDNVTDIFSALAGRK